MRRAACVMTPLPSGAGGGIHGGGPVTSSGSRGPTPRSAGMRWRTVASVPCGGISPSRAPDGEVVEQRVELGGRDPVAVAVVDLQARRLGARGLALGVLERDQPVGGRAAGLDAEAVLGVVHQLVGAQQHARHRPADVDEVLADRLELEHLVERRRAEHLGRRVPDQLGDVRHGVVRHVAVLLLGEVQQRDQRRLRPRVAPDDLLGDETLASEPATAAPSADPIWAGSVPDPDDPPGSRCGPTHRSTSPRTGSTERDDRDGVGDEAAAHHVRQRLDVDERRRPHVHPVRRGPPSLAM